MKQSIDFQGTTSTIATGIYRHNLRVENSFEHNENIDSNLTLQNVVFEDKDIGKAIQLISDTKIAGGLQAKSQTFTTFVIQAGSKNNNLGNELAKEYFQKSTDWLKQQFGNENIIQSVAHFDETTPHLHVIVSNLTKEKDKTYCSSKRAFGFTGLTKQEVREKSKAFADDFFKNVSSGFGFDAPSSELGTKGKESIREWKLNNSLKDAEIQKDALKSTLIDKHEHLLVMMKERNDLKHDLFEVKDKLESLEVETELVNMVLEDYPEAQEDIEAAKEKERRKNLKDSYNSLTNK